MAAALSCVVYENCVGDVGVVGGVFVGVQRKYSQNAIHENTSNNGTSQLLDVARSCRLIEIHYSLDEINFINVVHGIRFLFSSNVQ